MDYVDEWYGKKFFRTCRVALVSKQVIVFYQNKVHLWKQGVQTFTALFCSNEAVFALAMGLPSQNIFLPLLQNKLTIFVYHIKISIGAISDLEALLTFYTN